jgi:negative regulator of sigma-B (phosphoserine phosphatase)
MEAMMNTTVVNREQCVEWSVASRALPGQTVSGDLHIVSTFAHGVLIGVVDGLGHGDDATFAARTAVNVLAENSGESVITLVHRCHRALQNTRGAVMTLVSINTADDTATMLGVGNVECAILRANPQGVRPRESVLLRGGVVGYQLPALHASFVPFAPGDLVVFATDGVREDYSDLINAHDAPADQVDRIMARKFRGTDDGLVLACKYLGKP